MLPVGRGGIHGECFGRWGSVSAGWASTVSGTDVCSGAVVLSEMVSVMAAEGASEEVAAVSLAASCLPQPARAQVPKAASTAQLSVFSENRHNNLFFLFV